MNQKNDFDEARDGFLKLIPVIPILLTITGAAKLFIRYQNYNINIFHYIDINEILTLFISDIYLFIFSATIFPIYNLLSGDININLAVPESIEDKFWVKARKRFLRTNALIAFIVFFFTIINSFKEANIIIKGVILLFVIPALAILLSVKIYQLGNIYLNNNFSTLTSYIYRFYLFCCIGIILLTFNSTVTKEVFKPHHIQNDYIGSTIITNKKTINIDSNNVLIGRTKNYIFVYTLNDGCTEIIPASQIQELLLIEAHNKFQI